jgi:signal transduction histidine kinase
MLAALVWSPLGAWQLRGALGYFYGVTFMAFAALVISLFVAGSFGSEARSRHQLITLAFAWLGGFFFLHAGATPNTFLHGAHPTGLWSGALALTGGAFWMTLAAILPSKRDKRPFIAGLALSVMLLAAYLTIAIGWPDGLTQAATPLVSEILLWTTLGLWSLSALVSLWRYWKLPHGLNGMAVLNAVWGAAATVTFLRFPGASLAWWLHAPILLGMWALTMLVLWRSYQRAHTFQLTRYYAVASLIATAGLALIAGHVYASYVYGNLVTQTQSTTETLTRALSASLAGYLRLETRAQVDALRADPDLDTWVTNQLRTLDVLDEGALYATTGVRVYAAEGGATSLPAIQPAGSAAFLGATRGQIGHSLVRPGDDDSLPGDRYHLLTYTPVEPVIGSGGQPVGVLVTVREVADLAESESTSRQVGLAVAALSLGLLFVALLGLVRRADQVIVTRTQELEQAYADLRQTTSQRDDLTQMIVHDLRNPLTAIAANLDLLGRNGETPQSEVVERLVGRALNASQRMMGMIDDLLNINQFESGQLKLYPQPFDLLELLIEKAELFRPQAEREGKTLVVYAPGPLPKVHADPALVGRVIENLLSNAFKYTTIEGQIEISAEERGESLMAWVRDNGLGVPEDQRGRVFDKFFQGKDETGQPLRRGSGLGLTFCKLAIEAHGGQVGVEPAPDRGSIFYFSLPLRELDTRRPRPALPAGETMNPVGDDWIFERV